MSDHIQRISEELDLKPGQILAVVKLLDEGSTIVFIARYRKEMTGSLDEVKITGIRDRIHRLRELDKRRESVLQSIQEQGKLTDALKTKILAAETLTVLEDLYLPYRPKRRTRATIAKEKGLEPLAQAIFEQTGIDPVKKAEEFLNDKVVTIEDALAGSRDIIAEWVNENSNVRAALRRLFQTGGIIFSRVIKSKEEEGRNYRDYFAWQESVRTVPSHRILAVRRAEKEKILTFKIEIPEDQALAVFQSHCVKSKKADSLQVMQAAEDSFKRLLAPSLETEIRLELKKRADEQAIEIFRKNLNQILLQAPLGQKRVLAIDPGFRTGCKVVCLDEQGQLLHHDVIYPTGSPSAQKQATDVLPALCQKFRIEFIAIGNGTAGRETEQFVKSVDLTREIAVVMVNENGASVYSASDVARQEFPKHDVTVRGAVSIGRRLMDPLAELVKIDPKSIGVGQYQHDVDQGLLKDSLDETVISCVNQVGVEINTASPQLLAYVSGLNISSAQTIIDHRNRSGAFRRKEDLKNVSGIGPKSFEQAAGFIRIAGAPNPLDASAVHPESYHIVEQMAAKLNCRIQDLIAKEDLRKKIRLQDFITETVGLPTLQDIGLELAKPGRDPRRQFELFSFKEGVSKITDLKIGMTFPGVVTNIAAFGVFVDIGVHCDGLVHISEMSERFVKDPNEIVKLNQKVNVKVLSIDLDRKRISLTMKSGQGNPAKKIEPGISSPFDQIKI